MEFHLIIGKRIDISGLNLPEINNTNNKIIIHDYTHNKVNNINFNIPEDSLVIIDAHGTTGVYNIELFLEHYSIKHTLEKLSNNKHLNFELFACFSGAAINMAPLSSTLITLSSANHTSIEYLNNELIHKAISFESNDNPFIRFASYIFTIPDQVQFAINRNKINEIFNNKKFLNKSIDKLEDYSTISIKEWQIELLESFLNFLSKIKFGLDKKYHEKIEQIENMELLKNSSWLSQFNIARYRELLLINMINLVKVDIVKKIINSSVNINAKLSTGANAVYIAAQGISAMESLEQGNIAKTKELEAGYLEIIQTLIKKKALIDEENNTGDTPLLISAQGGHLDILNALIKAGARINKQNHQGDTALNLAALNGRIDIVTALLKAKSSVILQNNAGATAMYLVAQAGHYEIAKKLIEDERSLVNIKINNNRSPLHIATQNGHFKIVEILLQNNALVNNIDSSGISALDLAIYFYHEVLDFFKKEIFNSKNIKNDDKTKTIDISNMKESIKNPLLESLKFIRKEIHNLTLADIATYINNNNSIIEKLLDNGAKLQYFALDSTAIQQIIKEGKIFSSSPIIYILSYNNHSDFASIYNFANINYHKTKVLFT